MSVKEALVHLHDNDKLKYATLMEHFNDESTYSVALPGDLFLGVHITYFEDKEVISQENCWTLWRLK